MLSKWQMHCFIWKQDHSVKTKEIYLDSGTQPIGCQSKWIHRINYYRQQNFKSIPSPPFHTFPVKRNISWRREFTSIFNSLELVFILQNIVWKDRNWIGCCIYLKKQLRTQSKWSKFYCCFIMFTNQKKKMEQIIHHCKTDKSNSNAVAALGKQVHHIFGNEGTKLQQLSDYQDDAAKQWQTITPKDMITAWQSSYWSRPSEGGAMALKLSGVNDIMIMKMGCWSSLTITMYIHNQIGNLSKGLTA